MSTSPESHTGSLGPTHTPTSPALLLSLGSTGAWTAPPTVTILKMTHWVMFACMFFFTYFGFADEAIKNYRFVFQSMTKWMGYSGAMFLTQTSSNGYILSSFPLALLFGLFIQFLSDLQLELKIPQMSSTAWQHHPPIFIHKDMMQKCNLFNCFSNMTASFTGLDYSVLKADKWFGEELAMPLSRTTAVPQD
ncbi:Fungal pheromone STE3G-protein-coupled receptor [Mycena venus]|uniref:Fungal pheromone STE3G-protein-coupled receptor n=1 Tax=Mycena venus TaxID=2733690 RepID=A0A8H7D3G9_9AGAR|nr:Fungal pheromone STE3G-protein-coupled receptor [Mycena venus]